MRKNQLTMQKPTVNPTKTSKNKGGRPSKAKQAEMMADIRSMWAEGLSTHTAQSELDAKGKHYSIETIQTYYREISNKINASRDQHYEEEEMEQKTRVISSIEKQIKKLTIHELWLDQCITIEKLRLQVWKVDNLDEKGEMKKGATPPPQLRTHVTAKVDLADSITAMRGLIHDIETQPTLTQFMEQRILDKIKEVQEQYQ
jgi:hypothetical protein